MDRAEPVEAVRETPDRAELPDPEVAMLEDEASRVIGSKSTLTATRFKIKTKLVQNRS